MLPSYSAQRWGIWGICAQSWVLLGDVGGEKYWFITQQFGSAVFLGGIVSVEGDAREASGTEVKVLAVASLSGSTLKDRGQGIWVSTDSICNTLLNIHKKYQRSLGSESLWKLRGRCSLSLVGPTGLLYRAPCAVKHHHSPLFLSKTEKSLRRVGGSDDFCIPDNSLIVGKQWMLKEGGN